MTGWLLWFGKSEEVSLGKSHLIWDLLDKEGALLRLGKRGRVSVKTLR